MAQPTKSTQIVQIGLENPSAPGPVNATKRILSWGVDIMPEETFDKFRPMGIKYDTIATVNKDWAGGTISGRMTYDEMLYLLASVLTTPSTTAIITGAQPVTAWNFNPSSTVADAPLTVTVEEGSSIVAYRAASMVVSDLTLKIDRGATCEVSGNTIGKKYNVGITLTPGATSLTPGPFVVQPGQVDVFIDPDSADLGTTQMLNCNSIELVIGTRFDAWWVLSTSQDSFAEVVEQVPAVKMTLTMGADPTGMGFLNTARLGQSVFIRVKCSGPEIGNTDHFMGFTFDFCGKIASVPKLGDTTNVVTVAWEFDAIHDGTWGKAMQAVLTNGLATTALAADSALTITPPVPVVTSVSPFTAVHTVATPIVIYGTGFTGATGVTVGGVACTALEVVSDTKIECTTGTSGSAGTVAVAVTTPGGTGTLTGFVNT